MTLGDLLVTTIAALESEAIPYMLTGSLASALYGEPRTTRDIDIVIDPDRRGLGRLLDRLVAAGAYLDRDAAATALRERGQFNAILGDAKIDFIVRKDRPFSRLEFERRRRTHLPGMEAYVVSAEDLILAKLVWARETDSDRQRRDVEGIVAIVGETLDRAYIEQWAQRLGVAAEWRAAQAG